MPRRVRLPRGGERPALSGATGSRSRSSSHLQNPADGSRQARPRVGLAFQLLSSSCREAVESRAAPKLGYTRLGLDPTLMFQAVKRRIERTLIHLKYIL